MDFKLLNDYPVFVFFIKFNIFAIPMYAAILLEFDFYVLQQATANIIYSILSFLNFSPLINGLMITIPVQNGTWAAVIDSACTGWKSVLLFLALVAATPKRANAQGASYHTHKKMDIRLLALLFVPVILFVNIVRIVFMFWVASFDLAYFQFAHTVVWSWGMILVIVAFWLFWMLKMNNTKLKRTF